MAAACGGDIVGNWRVTSGCITATGTYLSPNCPNARQINTFQITGGTASFYAGLTYNLTFTVGLNDSTVYLPPSCLTVGGVTSTCAQVNEAYASHPPPDTTSFRCAPAAGGFCACVSTFAPYTSIGGGTYSTSGGILTTNQPNYPPDGYCVRGNQLELGPTSLITLTGFESTGGAVLTRQ